MREIPQNYEDQNAKAEIRETILALAKFILSPRQVTMARLIISEAREYPELAQQFHDDCLAYSQAIVAKLLRKLEACGGENAESAAYILIGATLGSLHLRALTCGLDISVINSELEDRVDTALNLMGSLLNHA